ncbi:MAG: 23S rRNA (pseudouridine(1915)-N(3))-methyltransferase RlmH [Lachnospiraceae bacterium]|nr:23S rRNA (pseudouridine(1915)-N(3))-methyltransferase RlmH [Lachnospiraceae bacterium]
MNIKIIAVGKVKEAFYRDAIAEFQKRLSAYAKLEVIEVADESTPEHASAKLQQQIKDKEAERILKAIREDSFVVTLEIDGKKCSSEQFAKQIDNHMISGVSSMVFVIGGSLGLSPKVSGRSQWKLSFSDMTFPHQLMRVILLEQIYRAFRIINREPYHK